MKFNPIAQAPEGNYQLKVTNIILGTQDLVDKYSGEDITCSFMVRKSVIGDINYDGQISIADVTALVNIIHGKDNVEPYVYNHDAADIDNDGSYTTADVTALVNIILGKE